MPAAAPISAINRLSVRSCRAMRARLAPSAMRTAISWRRVAARIKSRFATLAQAISSTNATAPTRTSSEVRTLPIRVSLSGMIRATGLIPPARGSGGIARAIASSSLFACSGVASARSRPMTGKRKELPGSSRSASGVQTWEAAGNVNPRGMTPTTVRVMPSRVIAFPRIARSPLKRARQSRSLRMTTRSVPA